MTGSPADPAELSIVDGLAGVRKALGLTQEQVAAAMGVTQQTVQRIEAGWPNTYVRTLVAYVTACGGGVTIHLIKGEITCRIL